MTKPNKAYSVHLENVETKKITFLKIEDCEDMDACIQHVRTDYPIYAWDITYISPISPRK